MTSVVESEEAVTTIVTTLSGVSTALVKLVSHYNLTIKRASVGDLSKKFGVIN